jgi:hypothetical protein
MTMPVLSIIHRTDHLKPNYVLHALARQWEGMGYRVTVGAAHDAGAELGLLHIDRTRLNPASLPPPPPGVAVLNGGILDISKRRFSTLLLGPDSDWPGPVIVKTDLNAFGKPERGNRKPTWREALKARIAKVSWRHAHTLPRATYPVLPALARVPGWVWKRRDLIVEKFLPEREGDLYCLRGWMFFGAAGYGYRLYSTHPTVKIGSIIRHEFLTDVPPEIAAQRRALGFDFGKFDYVMQDGQAILLDINKTPTFRGDPDSPRVKAMAEAIRGFLP